MALYDEIQEGESRTLEFKAELPKDSEKWIKTVVAFANGAGGKIVVGVNDERQIVGLSKGTDIFELKDAIADTIAQMCEPQIMFDITAEKIDAAQLLILRVYPCNATPYYIKKQGRKNGTYIRLGATTRPADWTALDELQFRGKRIFYDSLANPSIKITNKDINSLCKEFSEKADRKITSKDLINFGLLVGEDHKTGTNACAILLGKHDFTSRIQCARFKGVDRTFFIDKKEFEGSLCSQIDGAYNFVLTHINMALEISGIAHKEIYEIPVAAIRELIINAAVHRNYQMTSSIQVAVYDDRVEITSPGTLYGSLTIEEAVDGHSALRNPVLARTLEKIGVTEGWGSGLKRITRLCKDYAPGFRPLEIKELGDIIRFNIYRPKAVSVPDDTINDTINDKVPNNDTSNDTLNDTINDTINDTLNDTLNLSDSELKILNQIKNDCKITRETLIANIGCSDSTVARGLKSLQQKGIISREGAKKNGFWVVTKL